MHEQARESSIQRQIIAAVGRIPHIRVWRANAGAAMRAGRLVRFGVPGQADITGIIGGRHGGRRLEIEVKRPDRRNRLSPEQKNFAAMIRRMGGIHIVATSPEDVRAVLRSEGVIA
jgi:hypothetical protein